MTIPRLRSPLVLVHGLFGFDRFRVGGMTLARYFPGIIEMLEAAHNRVLVPSLSPTSGVAERAAQLKAYLDRHSPGEPVHIIAHSMGGLDSRYLISQLGMSRRVLSLTTLGTPHRGSSFADWALGRLARLLRPFFELFSIPTQAFYDVTVARCREFNEKVPDAPGVRYFSVAARHVGNFFSHPEWVLSHQIVKQAEGENDGVVSIASATYGERVDIWDGDHLSLVNWLRPFGVNRGWSRNPSERYGPLLRRLADEGF
jgi:triacylglycerol lipase